MNLVTFAIVIVSVTLNALAQVVLRRAMTATTLPSFGEPVKLALTLAGNGWLWAGLVCCVASIGVWLVVLSRLQVSAAYPLASVGYILAAVMGVVWLGEALTMPRVMGLALICGGVCVISATA